MEKKKWKKPELIVLVRGNPEEAVLTFCKTDFLGSSWAGDYRNCGQPTAIGCGNACAAISAS